MRFKLLIKVGMSIEELDGQERRLIFIQDQRGALTKARNQGLQQGIEQGIEQGRLAEKLNIACSLLDILDDVTIALKVGVTVEEVRALRTV